MEEANDYRMTSVYSDLAASVRENGYIFPSGMIRRIQDLKDGADVHGLSHETNNKTMVKPGGDYLITHHTGGYEILCEAHSRIFDYTEENRLVLGKWIYEEIVIGDCGVRRTEEYVLKLAVKVSK